MIRKILNNNFVQIIAALVIVGMISGLVLVMVYQMTGSKIKINQNREYEKAVLKLFPTADLAAPGKKTAKQGGKALVEVVDKQKKVLGYAFLAQGNGYQGEIKILAGANEDFTQLVGFEVLESQETPGLGAEIASDNFRKQFEGLSITHAIEYVKNEKPDQPYEIEAITGATISSRAVVNLLNKRIEEIRKELKQI